MPDGTLSSSEATAFALPASWTSLSRNQDEDDERKNCEDDHTSVLPVFVAVTVV
jgi:hypothetical protein